MEKHVNKFVLVWALALTAFVVMGLTIPNTFTAGTTISSAEMNANFDAVKTAVDALEAGAVQTNADVAALQADLAVVETQIASRGTVVGSLRVLASGTTQQSWMANGNTPTVSHVAASGQYDITWPGEDVNITTRAVLVELMGDTGEAHVSSSAGVLFVRTANSAGTPTDLQFRVVIFND